MIYYQDRFLCLLILGAVVDDYTVFDGEVGVVKDVSHEGGHEGEVVGCEVFVWDANHGST